GHVGRVQGRDEVEDAVLENFGDIVGAEPILRFAERGRIVGTRRGREIDELPPEALRDQERGDSWGIEREEAVSCHEVTREGRETDGGHSRAPSARPARTRVRIPPVSGSSQARTTGPRPSSADPMTGSFAFSATVVGASSPGTCSN